MTKGEILEKVKFHAVLRGLSKNTQDEYYIILGTDLSNTYIEKLII